jgi:hypothetical protein
MRRSVLIALTTFVVAVAVYEGGLLVVAALIVLLAAAALLTKPVLAIAVAVTIPIAVEPDWPSSVHLQAFYNLIPGTKIAPVELLVFIAVIAGLLTLGGVRDAVGMLGMLRPALMLLVIGLLVGAITGISSGVGVTEVINDSRNAYEIFLVPIAVVCIVGHRVSLRTALTYVFGLTSLKCVAGVVAYVIHQSSPSGSSHLTYYLAPTNILTMFALLYLLSARMERVRLPRWMWLSALPLLVSLTLSERRSFWLGTMLGVVILVVLLVGPRGRRLLLPGIAIIALTFALTLSGHIGGSWLDSNSSATAGNGSSLSGRLLSINPTTLSANPNDRYRTEERRNVLADLAKAPITGLGLGDNYVQHYPESYEDISHLYVHFAALWWWMKGGIFGLIGYVVLIILLIAAGVRVFLGHPDRAVSAAGIAAAAGSAGFAFAELTATFAGPDIRSSIVLGGLIGLLAVGLRETDASAAPSRRFFTSRVVPVA